MTSLRTNLVKLSAALFGALLLTAPLAGALAETPRSSAVFERPFAGHHWKHRRHHTQHRHAGHKQRPAVHHRAHRRDTWRHTKDWRRSDDWGHDNGWQQGKRRHRHGQQKSFTFGSISAGNLIGAILGAAAGTQIGKGRGRIAAIISGTIIGAVVGGKVGESMQADDQRRAEGVFERLPTGQTAEWHNPDTGVHYQVTPTRTYQAAANQHCRDYTSWAFVDGYEEGVHGTACRQSDGRWKLMN